MCVHPIFLPLGAGRISVRKYEFLFEKTELYKNFKDERFGAKDLKSMLKKLGENPTTDEVNLMINRWILFQMSNISKKLNKL